MINIIALYNNMIILFINFSIKFEKYLSEIDNMIYFEKIIKSDNNDFSFIVYSTIFNLIAFSYYESFNGIEF